MEAGREALKGRPEPTASTRVDMEVDVDDMVSSASSSSSSSSSSSTFGGLTSADMSQVRLQKGDSSESSKDFLPEHQYNASGQQIDLRERNSWKLKLEQVQTPELLEVFTINTMAPFILNGRLKSLMCVDACQNVGANTDGLEVEKVESTSEIDIWLRVCCFC